MSNNILDNIKKLSKKEQRNLSYDKLEEIINKLSPDEIIELSRIIGYPVFTRLCMGNLKHKFILLQDGAAAIIINKEKKILLQYSNVINRWMLPGGCQELGETFAETIIREIKEETNLDVNITDLNLINIISGPVRKHQYLNGDIVFNNTVLYEITKYKGTIKAINESKELRFFSLNEIPEDLLDMDLIEIYKNTKGTFLND